MPNRIIAIGDIHGCSMALTALIKAINPQQDDIIITLGDYVDRGIDSKGVLDQLIALGDKCHLIPVLGNHDQMMLHARNGKDDLQFWLNCGGTTALDSYGSTGKLGLIPNSHFQFLEKCVSYFETDAHFFVHANYKPELPLASQDDHTLRWLSLRDYLPGPHASGKIGVLGHTPHPDVLDLSHLVCIDTGCCTGGWLTALDVISGQRWQVSEKGSVR